MDAVSGGFERSLHGCVVMPRDIFVGDDGAESAQPGFADEFAGERE